MKWIRHTVWIQTMLGLAAVVLFPSATVGADWGSVRANNRESGEHREPGRADSHDHHPPENRIVPSHGPEHGHEVVVVRHHDDVEVDRHHGYEWSRYHVGMRLPGLPTGYLTFSFGGHPYYYNEGVYYQPAPSGFVVVNPPMGMVLAALPPGSEAVAVNGAVYYYAGGVFYFPQPNGYAVVTPPLGVVVSTLPPGAAPVLVNGVSYYLANGVYYLPVMQNGLVMYMTVRP